MKTGVVIPPDKDKAKSYEISNNSHTEKLVRKKIQEQLAFETNKYFLLLLSACLNNFSFQISVFYIIAALRKGKGDSFLVGAFLTNLCKDFDNI